MNKRNKIIAAFAAALAAGSIGVGVTTAPATPATPPPSADMRWAQLVELIRL